MPKETTNSYVLQYFKEHEDFEIEEGYLFCIYCKDRSSAGVFSIQICIIW